MKTVTLAEFTSPVEAESLQKRLIAAGIHAEVRAESKVEKMLSFFRASAGARIEVPREEFEAAFRLVYDWNAMQKTDVDEVSISGSKRGGAQAKDGENPWQP